MPPFRRTPALLMTLCLLSGCEPGGSDPAPLRTRAQGLQGTAQVANLWPEDDPAVPRHGNPSSLTRLGDTVLFAATDGVAGRELWRTDGTAAGTARVADLWPGVESSGPRELCLFAGRIYFIAQQPAGPEIWSTDGTAQGTHRAVEPAAGLSPEHLFAAADGLYIVSGPFPERHQEVWRVAPESATPVLLTAFSANGTLSVVHFVFTEGDTRYIRRRIGDVMPDELWRTDGTPGGTTRVAASGEGQWGATELFGGRLYFAALSQSGASLWSSAGTAETTEVFQQLRTGGSAIWSMDVVGTPTRLFFVGDSVEGPPGLWVSDGSREGTRLVTTLGPVRQMATRTLRTWGERAVFHTGPVSFAPNDGEDELWVSDGALDSHRVPLADNQGAPVFVRYPGDGRAVPEQAQFLFTAQTPQLGRELWALDADGSGAHPVTDIAPGPASSFGQYGIEVMILGDRLLFAADDGVSGLELWSATYPLSRIDGAADAGTADAGAPDAGPPDVGSADAGAPDAGVPDAGAPDTGAPDAGALDAGAHDAGASSPPSPSTPGAQGCAAGGSGFGAGFAGLSLLALALRRRRA